MCTLLEVSAAGYYEWLERGTCRKAVRDAELTIKIRQVHGESRKTYGVPRIHAELSESGEKVGRRRVARLMKNAQIQGCMRGRFKVRTTDSQHDQPIAPNLLDRIFNVPTLGTHWVADLTYIPTREGWLYLAVVLDLGDRSVIGWSAQESMERKIVIDSLKAAVKRRRPQPGCIFHSDRGSQYASDDFRLELF